MTDNAPSAPSATDVTVTLSPSDGSGDVSGIAKTQYRLEPSTTWLDTTANQFVVGAPSDGSNDGTHTYDYRALDNAGNASATESCAVTILTSKPTVTSDHDADTSWHNSDVTVTLSPADVGGPGVQKTQYRAGTSGAWIDTIANQFTVSALSRPLQRRRRCLSVPRPRYQRYRKRHRHLHDQHRHHQPDRERQRSRRLELKRRDRHPDGRRHRRLRCGQHPVPSGRHLRLDRRDRYSSSSRLPQITPTTALTPTSTRSSTTPVTSSATGSCTVRIATVKPTVSDNAPTGWSKTAVTVTLTPVDTSGFGIQKTQYRKSGSSTWLDTTANTFVVSAPADHSGDGANVYQYQAIDNNGLASDTGTCTVRIDTTGPTVTDNTDSAWHNSPVTVTLTAADSGIGTIGMIQYRLNGPSTPTWTAATMINATQAQFVVAAPANHANDGSHVYAYRAYDGLANIGNSSTGTVKIDTAGPTITNNAPTGWSATAVTVTLTASDSLSGVVSVQYNLDGAGWTSGTSVTVLAPADHSNDGTHTLQYQATDNAGNTTTGSCTVSIDTTIPTVTDNAPTGWSSVPVTVTLSPVDGGAGIAKTQYRLSSSADPSWHDTTANQFTVPAPADHSGDGVNVYRYRALDNLGNYSNVGTCTVRIDTTNPTVTDNAPMAWKKTAVTVTLTAADLGGSGVAKTQYRLAGSSTWLDTTANTFVVPAPADHSNDGINNYEYRALDNVGNVSSTGTCAVKIDTTAPTASDDAPAGWSGSDVTVTITALDAGSGVGIIQYRLSLPSDPTWHNATMINATQGQFTVSAPDDQSNDGVHVYRYRVLDNIGNISPSYTCTVRISTL